jgi:hypothetical protein
MTAAIVGGLIGAFGVVLGVFLAQSLRELSDRNRQLREGAVELTTHIAILGAGLTGKGGATRDASWAVGSVEVSSKINRLLVVAAGMPRRRRALLTKELRLLQALWTAALPRVKQLNSAVLPETEFMVIVKAVHRFKALAGRVPSDPAELETRVAHYIANGLTSELPL